MSSSVLVNTETLGTESSILKIEDELNKENIEVSPGNDSKILILLDADVIFVKPNHLFPGNLDEISRGNGLMWYTKVVDKINEWHNDCSVKIDIKWLSKRGSEAQTKATTTGGLPQFPSAEENILVYRYQASYFKAVVFHTFLQKNEYEKIVWIDPELSYHVQQQQLAFDFFSDENHNIGPFLTRSNVLFVQPCDSFVPPFGWLDGWPDMEFIDEFLRDTLPLEEIIYNNLSIQQIQKNQIPREIVSMIIDLNEEINPDYKINFHNSNRQFLILLNPFSLVYFHTVIENHPIWKVEEQDSKNYFAWSLIVIKKLTEYFERKNEIEIRWLTYQGLTTQIEHATMMKLPHFNLLIRPISSVGDLDKAESIISLFRQNLSQEGHKRKKIIWIDPEIDMVIKNIQNIDKPHLREDRDLCLKSLRNEIEGESKEGVLLIKPLPHVGLVPDHFVSIDSFISSRSV
jgi:hypothetical protein